jgi:hypothetical protein
MKMLDKIRPIWGLAVSICVLGLFYPNALVDVVTLLAGCLGWIAGAFEIGWAGLLRFVGASLGIVLILSIWCGHRAREAVLRTGLVTRIQPTGLVARIQQWDPRCDATGIVAREMRAVVAAFLVELLLPIILLIAFLALIGAVVKLLDIETAWETLTSDTLAALRKVWRQPPAAIHTDIAQALAAFRAAAATSAGAAQALEKGLAVITGAISAGVSLILFLLRRRSAHLNAARVIAEEIDLIVKEGFQSVPAILGNQPSLAYRPGGQLLIGASSDRQFLVLDPGTGLAAKLPSCLVRSALAFFQADLSLNQVYNGLLSEAFAKAKADAVRRQAYLTMLQGEWESTYQPAAYAALFRLGFYLRLRIWSI